MEQMMYFADTYALIEILETNPKYQKYLKAKLITAKSNLYELVVSFLKKGISPTVIREAYIIFTGNCVGIHDEDYFSAAAVKVTFSKKKLSYADALGYAMAKRRGIKFLTGDKAFKDLQNVEFITK